MAQTLDFGELGEAARGASASEDGDEINRLGDKRARNGDNRLLNELLEAAECANRRAGVERADSARMSGAPGLQEIERLRPAHFADRDAIGAQAQRRADEIGERGRAILGAKRDQVRRRALQLPRILDEHHPVAGLGDFGQQRVDERGLTGRSAPGDENVLALADRGFEQCRLVAAHDPGRDIIVEREHSDRWATDGETRRQDDRRNQPLKPLTGFGEFGRHARRAAMDLDADVMGDKPDDALRIPGRNSAAGVLQTSRQAINPEPAVGIEHHFDDARVLKVSGDRRAKRGAQHARAAGEGFRSEGDGRHVFRSSGPAVAP